MPIGHLPEWAKSRGQRPIALYHSGGLGWNRSTRPLVFIGGVHGDEPEGVRLAEATLGWLGTEPEGVAVPWILIPCLNPDGFAAGERTNAAGVDLNRNYPARSWTPEAKGPRYNPGPAPGSEPEIKAMVRLIETFDPRLIVHCHSWNPCIVFTGEPARKDAERLVEASGYTLQPTIGYDTPGSLSQYGWFDLGIPIICIEEQEHLESLDVVWPRFASGIKAIFADPSDRKAAG